MLNLNNLNITFPEGFLRQSLALLSRLVGSVERLTTAIEVRNPINPLPDIIGEPIKKATYFVRDGANATALEYAEAHRRSRMEEDYSPDPNLDIEELESLVRDGEYPNPDSNLGGLGELREAEERY